MMKGGSMIYSRTLIISLIITFSSLASASVEDDIGNISLESLLDIKVTIASGAKGLTVRESPGIVTLITSEEIQNSGARDLMDVLQLVPGLSFAMDVQGVVGIVARGNWSHEGKISLMIDDMEMNELSFATLQFGNHYPVENIERIELIRGPGSAIYGGFAEMGVIKIVSKKSSSVDASAMVGNMEDGLSRKTGSLATGKVFEQGAIHANLFFTQGSRSERNFSDFYDDSYSMYDNSDLETLIFNLGVNYQNFSARYLQDEHKVLTRDIFFVNAPYPVETKFKSQFFEFKYQFDLSDSLKLTPQIIQKNQKPWLSNSQSVIDLELLDPDSYGGQFFDEKLQRTTLKVTGTYDFNETDNLVFGASQIKDENKTINFKYDSIALFAQALIASELGNWTLGARWEDHSEAGNSFLPRLGFTKVYDKTHFKILWSKAFRAPVVQNLLDFNDPSSEGIKPENTTVFETEWGYKLSDSFFITANIFDIVIEDPIVYFFDGADSYRNYDEVHTQGIELEAKYQRNWGYLNFSYSHYRVADNQVDQYAIRSVDPDLDDDEMPLETDSQLLGAPNHKFTLALSYKLNDRVTLNSSIIHEASKYGYIGVTQDADEQLIPGKFDAITLVNFNVIYKQFMTKSINLQMGVFNALNEEVNYVQPYYDGYHAALPGPTREYFIRMRYTY